MLKLVKRLSVLFVVASLSACGVLEPELPDEEPLAPLTLEVTGMPESTVDIADEFTLTATVGGIYGDDAEIVWEYDNFGDGPPGELRSFSGRVTTFTAPLEAGDQHRLAVYATYPGEETLIEEVTFSIDFCSSGSFDDETNPCVIQNVVQLQAIGDSTERLAGHYKLGRDIDARVTKTWNDGRGFIPLGARFDAEGDYSIDDSEAFSGTLTGDGHTISGLFIDFSKDSGFIPVGLISQTAGDAEISNVIIRDAIVSGEASSGALVGNLEAATVENVAVQNSTIVGDEVGGMIGHIGINSLVRGSEVIDTEVSVNQYGMAAGGLAGSNFGRIEYAVVSGGSVTGTSHVGGLVGGNGMPFGEGPEASGILNSHVSDQVVSGSTYVGGLVGYSRQPIETSTSTNQTVSGVRMVGGLAGSSSTSVNQSHVLNSSVSVDPVNGDISAGGFAGSNSGAIHDSSVVGTPVTGNDNVGGFVGTNKSAVTGPDADQCRRGEIINSFVLLTDESTGVVGEIRVGGFVGYNEGAHIKNSYAQVASVSGSESVAGFTGYEYGAPPCGSLIENSYALAKVQGDFQEAGFGIIAGNSSDNEVLNSYWSEEAAAGLSDNSGATGLATTADFNHQANFRGWDFDAVWQMPEDGGAPDLRNNSRF